MADLRIRELQTDVLLPLDWELPFDFTGLAAAQKRTLQQVVDVMNENRDLQQILSGTTNPDNALGNNGDTYYKYVAGSEFAVYFKTNDVWDLLFTISIADSGVTVTGTTDASGEFDASATGTARLIAVYEGDVLIRPEFNKSTFLLSAMNPLTAITAYFI